MIAPRFADRVWVWLLLGGAVGWAQSPAPANERFLYKSASSTCQNIDFEKEGYTIGTAELKEPLSIPWPAASAAAKQVKSLERQKFTYSGAVNKEIDTLRGSSPFGAAAAFKISVSFVVVVGCANKTVDLEYDVYAIPPPNLASGTTEWQNGAQKATTSQPFHAAPDVVFAGWKQVSAGADLSYQTRNFSVSEKSRGSASGYNATVTGTGGFNFLGEISRLDVQFNGASSSSPIAVGQLATTQFSGQASATTRTFANGALQGRLGGLIEGGNLQSTLQSTQIAENSVASGEYVAGKFYGGLTWNTSHNVLSGSVGVEIGQVSFVGLVLLLEGSFRTLQVRWPRFAEALPGYAVGSLGALWTIQRVAILLDTTR